MVVLVVFVCVSLRGTDMGLLYVPKGMCVCTVGSVCKSKVCHHPPTLPTHPPQPKGMCVCVQLGVYASPRYVTIHPPHPPTHPNPKVCVCVCTDESPKTRCVYRWVKSVCADESSPLQLGCALIASPRADWRIQAIPFADTLRTTKACQFVLFFQSCCSFSGLQPWPRWRFWRFLPLQLLHILCQLAPRSLCQPAGFERNVPGTLRDS